MKAIDVLRMALQMTDEGTAHLVADMRDAPLTQPTPGGKGGGGNHPLWTLGHLAWVEGGFEQVLFGRERGPNPLAHWESIFGTGSTPKAEASAYPSFDEVLGKYRDMRARTLKMLDEVGDAGLDHPPKQVPPGFEDSMQTIGQTLLLLALHNMVHYGQIADARRVAGRKPLL